MTEGLIQQNKIKIQYSASSVYSDRYIYKLFDYTTTTWFCSENIPGSFFQVDFVDSLVKIYFYYITVGDWESYPKSWNVTGFNGKTWLLLSDIEDNKMNENKIQTFDIYQNKQKYFYSSIRLTMTKQNYGKNDYFCVADFDITGEIYSSLGFIILSNNKISILNQLLSCISIFLLSH